MYKIDGSELYEYQQQLLQPPEDIPIWEKKCLTVEERLLIQVLESED